jgi:hypothetical protein
MRKTIIMCLFFILLFTMSVLLCGAIPAKERSALIALYNSTNGDNWVNNEGWKTPPLHTDGFALPGTEGNWNGITVNNDQVEKIYMVSNNLSGTIPAELGNLISLKELRLNNNQLEGNIPAVLSNLSYLTYLALHSNKLCGSIPLSLIYLSLLSDLKIGYNALYTDNDTLRDFLNSKDPNWETTQTTAPSDLSAAVISGSSVEVSWTPISYTEDPGGYLVYYSMVSGRNYTPYNDITADKSISKMEVTGLNPDTTYYFVVQTRTDPHTNNSNTVVSNYSREVTTSGPNTPPKISLNRRQLNFGYVMGGTTPSAQTFRISNRGGGLLNWAVVNWFSRISVSPVSGSGSGIIEVLMDPTGLNPGGFTAEIEVIGDYASNSPQVVNINLTVKKSSDNQSPFGTLSTPQNNSTVSSSIPVTGWALDDIGVKRVEIYRNPVTNEGQGLIYLGEAIFVEGARSDIEGAYSGYPNNYKAGWGYMLLTNFLPNGGNGTFTLHAKAIDVEGKETILGTATIICDNANAKKPFGAIDTPTQGGTISGSSYRNQGWVLTPLPNKIPEDGSTINVYIDGINVGNPSYNIYRSDIATLFPGYANSNGALGHFDFDTTKYENGVHTIFWTAEDDAGNSDGIGSRYFTIQNLTGRTAQGTELQGSMVSGQGSVVSEKPVEVIKGYKKDVESQQVYPEKNGIITIEITELERIEFYIYNNGARVEEKGSKNSKFKIQNSKLYSGYQVIGDRLTSLPTGSTLDQKRGVFYWQPGPGFYGDYDFVFIKEEGNNKEQVRIRVKILPRFNSR